MQRNILNILMFAMMIFMMMFRYFPHRIHEIVGVIILITLGLHWVVNKGWFTTLGKGSWQWSRILPTALNVLLIVDFLAVMISGIMISHWLFRSFMPAEFHRSIFLKQIHIAGSWLILLLIGIHVGFHGKALWNKVIHGLGLDVNSPVYSICCRILVIVVALGGIGASFAHQVGDHLMMLHVFATPASSSSGTVFALLLVLLVGLYAIIGRVIQYRLQLKSK